jgi:hypothetical protein
MINAPRLIGALTAAVGGAFAPVADGDFRIASIAGAAGSGSPIAFLAGVWLAADGGAPD